MLMRETAILELLLNEASDGFSICHFFAFDGRARAASRHLGIDVASMDRL
jgi:hypothetical protein